MNTEETKELFKRMKDMVAKRDIVIVTPVAGHDWPDPCENIVALDLETMVSKGGNFIVIHRGKNRPSGDSDKLEMLVEFNASLKDIAQTVREEEVTKYYASEHPDLHTPTHVIAYVEDGGSAQRKQVMDLLAHDRREQEAESSKLEAGDHQQNYLKLRKKRW